MPQGAQVHTPQVQTVATRRTVTSVPTRHPEPRAAARTLLTAAVVALLCVGAFVVAPFVPPAAAQDGPTVSVGDVSGLERDDAIGSVMVPVFLDRIATEPVVVSYYTVNDTAIYFPPEDRVDPELFGDYQRRGTPEIPRTVSIPAGSLQTTINVAVNVDDEVEPDEDFLVVIASVSGANATVGRDTGTATIVDPDGLASANPVITVSSGSVIEGASGQRRAQFFVHLSKAAASIVSFSYTTADGSATAPGDYLAKLPGAATFAPGQISKTIDVLVGSDATVGTDRAFTLEVGVLGGAPVEELRLSGTATVLDDDQAPPAVITPSVVAGNSHTCRLDASGAVQCWGGNLSGQLGNGTNTDSLSPVAVTGLDGPVTEVVAGDNQTCALTTAGGVKCWGNNDNGQLGNGTLTASNVPVDVTGLASGVTSLAAGDNHTCAALGTGGVKCWGWGTAGQLGAGTATSSTTPVDVVGLPAGTTATALSAAYRHTCAVLSDGSARCWGRNNDGRLGNGTFTNSNTPVTPVGLTSGVTAIAAGGVHTCAVQAGAVKCWGLNGAGQLGNNSTATSNTPVTAVGLTEMAAVTAGGTHSCARSVAGSVWCWGLNQEGELGIGEPTTNNATTPRQVTALTSPQSSLSAGIQHVCSLQADQSVRCWGLNTSGQLGNGTTTRSFSPVVVLGL